jgi:hypothetical protein
MVDHLWIRVADGAAQRFVGPDGNAIELVGRRDRDG